MPGKGVLSLKGFFQTFAVGIINETIFEGSSKTTIQVKFENIQSGVIRSGDVLNVFDADGNITELTLTSNVTSSATTISFSSRSFDNQISVGSILYYQGARLHNKISARKLYAQQSIYLTAGTNGNDYLTAFGTSSFSVNSAVQLANGNSKPNRWGSQYGIFVAPNDCEITKIKGTASSNAGTGDDAVISVWEIAPNYGSTSNVTLNLINSFTLTSQNNQNHIFDIDNEPAHDLSEGDVVFFSIKRTGEKASGIKWYADIGLEIKMHG